MLIHPDSHASLNDWMSKLKVANWKTPADIRYTFSTSDLLGNHSDRVVFNIGGNKYRMIAKYYFGKQQVHLFICWIGTHAEYTKICKENKQFKLKCY